jgi:hypothetical protein
MSELFGLEYTHSLESELLRQRIAELEAKEIRGTASQGEQLELLDLVQDLPEPDGSVVERVAEQLLAE